MAFEVLVSNREWSDCIELPIVENDEKNRILKKIKAADNTQFKIGHCEVIPELSGVAFAENATFAELNFLAERIEKICEDQTQICAYRALMSEIPDNICEAINSTYGLETIAVYPCESLEEYGDIVLDNDFLEELDEIPYELYDLLDREKVGALMQEREGGMFINGYYVIPSGYDPVLAYDGIVLPVSDEEPAVEMEVEML